MGNLKPGATYIYERDGKTVYAREAGSDPSTRVAVGWEYEKDKHDFDRYMGNLSHEYLWNQIFEEAKTNPALQEAIERVKLIYYLSKEQNGS